MEVKFCAHAGCHEVAIGVARWDKDIPTAKDHCRTHYLSDVLTSTVTCEVIGPCPVTDVRTQQGVGRGGRVELDPDEVNVAQLVYAGHVKLVDPQPPAPAAKAAAGKAKD